MRALLIDYLRICRRHFMSASAIADTPLMLFAAAAARIYAAERYAAFIAPLPQRCRHAARYALRDAALLARYACCAAADFARHYAADAIFAAIISCRRDAIVLCLRYFFFFDDDAHAALCHADILPRH